MAPSNKAITSTHVIIVPKHKGIIRSPVTNDIEIELLNYQGPIPPRHISLKTLESQEAIIIVYFSGQVHSSIHLMAWSPVQFYGLSKYLRTANPPANSLSASSLTLADTLMRGRLPKYPLVSPSTSVKRPAQTTALPPAPNTG